jgi:hypothetical protein
LSRPVDRLELLHIVLSRCLTWRERLASPALLQAWEGALAFREEWVQVLPVVSSGPAGATGRAGRSGASDGLPLVQGQVIGLAMDGSLKLRAPSGEVLTVQVGDVRLRPCQAIKQVD